MAISLHDISSLNFDSGMKERFMDLVFDDSLPKIIGRVRSIDHGMPCVELFKRTEPDNLLVSINQTLIMEATMSK